MKSNGKNVDEYKRLARYYDRIEIDGNKVTMLRSNAARDLGVEIIAGDYNKVTVSCIHEMGAVRRSCGEGINLIAGCGDLINSLGYGVEKFVSAMHCSPYEWSVDECILDLEDLIEDAKNELSKMENPDDDEDGEILKKDIEKYEELIDKGYWEHQQSFIDDINLLWDDCEAMPYRAGEQLTDQCFWTLSMLWRASSLIREESENGDKEQTNEKEATLEVLQEVAAEREKQRAMWGNAIDDNRCHHDWVAIIVQELQPMCWTDEESMRKAAIKVAATAIAAVDAHDRKKVPA